VLPQCVAICEDIDIEKSKLEACDAEMEYREAFYQDALFCECPFRKTSWKKKGNIKDFYLEESNGATFLRLGCGREVRVFIDCPQIPLSYKTTKELVFSLMLADENEGEWNPSTSCSVKDCNDKCIAIEARDWGFKFDTEGNISMSFF